MIFEETDRECNKGDANTRHWLFIAAVIMVEFGDPLEGTMSAGTFIASKIELLW